MTIERQLEELLKQIHVLQEMYRSAGRECEHEHHPGPPKAILPHVYRRPLRCDVCGNFQNNPAHIPEAPASETAEYYARTGKPHVFTCVTSVTPDNAIHATCKLCGKHEFHSIHGYTGD